MCKAFSRKCVETRKNQATVLLSPGRISVTNYELNESFVSLYKMHLDMFFSRICFPINTEIYVLITFISHKMNSKKLCVCTCCGDRLNASSRRPLNGKCLRLFVATRVFPTSLSTDGQISLFGLTFQMDSIPSDENMDEQSIKVPIEVVVFSRR